MSKILKKQKTNSKRWNFGNILYFKSLLGLSTKFVKPFRATFIFGESQAELFIKSYCRLKFFRPKFLNPKIYDNFIQCKNSTIKYILNQVADKKFGSKINFQIFLMNFTKFLTSWKEKRQGVSNQAFMAFMVEIGPHIKCIASLKTYNGKNLSKHLCRKC